MLDELVASGATEYRTDATWAVAEPNAPVNGVHTYVWSSLDQIATALADQHLRWYPILDYSAPWQSSDGTQDGEPNDPAYFAAYAAAFAARYGANGTFWAANPSVPYVPVQEYEIWNEENYVGFWTEQSNIAEAYGSLLLQTQAAIRAVQPAATVVLGGVLDAGGNDALSFLQQLEQAHPGILAQIGAVAYHPYQQNLATILSRIAALRSLLDQDGATTTPIEVTETDANVANATASTWASDLGDLAAELSGSNCNVTHFFPYMDAPSTAGETDVGWDGYFVLFHANGTPSDLGSAYLGAVQSLTSSGATANDLCSPVGSTAGAAGSSSTTTSAPTLKPAPTAKTRTSKHLLRANRRSIISTLRVIGTMIRAFEKGLRSANAGHARHPKHLGRRGLATRVTRPSRTSSMAFRNVVYSPRRRATNPTVWRRILISSQIDQLATYR